MSSLACTNTLTISLYVAGHGILGLIEVLVEIWVFTFFESLICLKYTGKVLEMLRKISQSYERFNDVVFYEIFGRIYYTCSHKYFNAQEHTVYLCNKLLSVESFCCNLWSIVRVQYFYFFDHMIIWKAVNIYFGQY